MTPTNPEAKGAVERLKWDVENARAGVPLSTSADDLRTVLNLIQSQQAEIERLKRPIDWDALERESVARGVAVFIQEKKINQ